MICPCNQYFDCFHIWWNGCSILWLRSWITTIIIFKSKFASANHFLAGGGGGGGYFEFMPFSSCAFGLMPVYDKLCEEQDEKWSEQLTRKWVDYDDEIARKFTFIDGNDFGILIFHYSLNSINLTIVNSTDIYSRFPSFLFGRFFFIVSTLYTIDIWNISVY